MKRGESAGQPSSRHRLTASDGVSLAWYRFGVKGGTPLVLCHGLAAGGEQFFADAGAFAALGFDVIVPDLRGHGQSGAAPFNELSAYSVSRMGRDIIEMLDTAGVKRVHFVGNSLGGIIAFHLIKEHADRFASLTTFGTAPALSLIPQLAGFIPLSYRIAGKELTARLTATMTTSNRAARPMIEKLVAAFDPRVGEAIATHVASYDLLDNLTRFNGPVLILRGGKDRAVNLALDPALKKLGRKPNIKLVRIAEAGHCINLDQPERFRSAITDFIGGL